MITGQEVTLVADKNQIIKRTLVAVEDDVVFVCKPEEFRAAMAEHREPVCIGFKQEYVVQRGSK